MVLLKQNPMPPREIFPNPEQVRALTPKSERSAQSIRDAMPFSSIYPWESQPSDLEKREATPEESFLMRKAEESIDTVFAHVGYSDTAAIGMEHVRILNPSRGEEGTQDFVEHTTGFIDSFSHIVLKAFDAKATDGTREFLKTAVHEFIHAKSKNRWTIGEKTLRQICGFRQTIGRNVSFNLEESRLVPTEVLFTAFNEAMTETLAVLVRDELFTSSWYVSTLRERERRSADERAEYAEQYGISEGAIGAMTEGPDGNMRGHVSYPFEQQALRTMMVRIANLSQMMTSDVVKAFHADYMEGTMKRVIPLLHTAYGPDILRVLAAWKTEDSEEAQSLLLQYLQEQNPQERDALAKEYLEKHGTIAQSS